MKKRLTEVSILTFDLEAAARAWKDILGLEAEAAADQRTLQAGDVSMRLLPPESGTAAAEELAERGEGLYELTIEVDDVVAEMADLRVKDVLVSGVSIGADGRRQVRVDPRSTHGVPIRLVEKKR